jgi:hypothetical protein
MILFVVAKDLTGRGLNYHLSKARTDGSWREGLSLKTLVKLSLSSNLTVLMLVVVSAARMALIRIDHE